MHSRLCWCKRSTKSATTSSPIAMLQQPEYKSGLRNQYVCIQYASNRTRITGIFCISVNSFICMSNWWIIIQRRRTDVKFRCTHCERIAMRYGCFTRANEKCICFGSHVTFLHHPQCILAATAVWQHNWKWKISIKMYLPSLSLSVLNFNLFWILHYDFVK